MYSRYSVTCNGKLYKRLSGRMVGQIQTTPLSRPVLKLKCFKTHLALIETMDFLKQSKLVANIYLEFQTSLGIKCLAGKLSCRECECEFDK